MDFPSPASQVPTIDVRFAKSSAPRCLRTATKIAIRKSQMKSGVPDRLRSGDLLHERQACWLDYTTGTKIGEGKRSCTFDLMHVTHPLWLAELYPRKWWGRRVLPSLPLACQTSALLMSYVPQIHKR